MDNILHSGICNSLSFRVDYMRNTIDDGMRSCLEKNKYLLEVIDSLQVERSRHLKKIEDLQWYKDYGCE